MLMDEPVPIEGPLPQAVAYHLIVPPDPPVAVRVTDCPEQAALGEAIALVGGAVSPEMLSMVEVQAEFPQGDAIRAK